MKLTSTNIGFLHIIFIYCISTDAALKLGVILPSYSEILSYISCISGALCLTSLALICFPHLKGWLIIFVGTFNSTDEFNFFKILYSLSYQNTREAILSPFAKVFYLTRGSNFDGTTRFACLSVQRDSQGHLLPN